MHVAEIHHPCAEPPPDIVLEQHVIGHHNRGASSRLESAHDVFNKCKLLVRCVGRD
jgi:hypothetical protein